MHRLNLCVCTLVTAADGVGWPQGQTPRIPSKGGGSPPPSPALNFFPQAPSASFSYLKSYPETIEMGDEQRGLSVQMGPESLRGHTGPPRFRVLFPGKPLPGRVHCPE